MSWSKHNLGDFCEVIAGQSPEGKYYNESGNGLPFYQGKKEFGDRYIGAPQKWTTKITKEAKAGDILMSVRAPVGPINFSTEQICIGRGLAAIRASDRLDSDFLFYYLLSKQNEIQGSEGAVFASINKSQIEGLSISYVDLKEQKRIVAILDQAFADIDKARALTEQNLKNARELFESYLQQVFSQRGEGWVDKTLIELTVALGDGLHGTPKYSDDGEYYFVNGNNLNDGAIEIKERTKRVGEEEYKKYKKPLNERTVLVSINGTLGNVSFYNDEKVVLGKSACYFNLLDGVNKQYIRYVIESPLFQSYCETEATGATIKNVSLKSMRAFPVPLAPELNQKEIVSKLDKLKKITSMLEALYQNKLIKLDELKKSLLQKAFTGELIKGNKEAA